MGRKVNSSRIRWESVTIVRTFQMAPRLRKSAKLKNWRKLARGPAEFKDVISVFDFFNITHEFLVCKGEVTGVLTGVSGIGE